MSDTPAKTRVKTPVKTPVKNAGDIVGETFIRYWKIFGEADE